MVYKMSKSYDIEQKILCQRYILMFGIDFEIGKSSFMSI